jgi:hypothetical protein
MSQRQCSARAKRISWRLAVVVAKADEPCSISRRHLPDGYDGRRLAWA